jgi:hypothetical protein
MAVLLVPACGIAIRELFAREDKNLVTAPILNG